MKLNAKKMKIAFWINCPMTMIGDAVRMVLRQRISVRFA